MEKKIRKLSLSSREGTGGTTSAHKTIYDYAVNLYMSIIIKKSLTIILSFLQALFCEKKLTRKENIKRKNNVSSNLIFFPFQESRHSIKILLPRITT